MIPYQFSRFVRYYCEEGEAHIIAEYAFAGDEGDDGVDETVSDSEYCAEPEWEIYAEAYRQDNHPPIKMIDHCYDIITGRMISEDEFYYQRKTEYKQRIDKAREKDARTIELLAADSDYLRYDQEMEAAHISGLGFYVLFFTR